MGFAATTADCCAGRPSRRPRRTTRTTRATSRTSCKNESCPRGRRAWCRSGRTRGRSRSRRWPTARGRTRGSARSATRSCRTKQRAGEMGEKGTAGREHRRVNKVTHTTIKALLLNTLTKRRLKAKTSLIVHPISSRHNSDIRHGDSFENTITRFESVCVLLLLRAPSQRPRPARVRARRAASTRAAPSRSPSSESPRASAQ